jgi:hypothetical protein
MKAWPRIIALAARFVFSPRMGLSLALSRPWSLRLMVFPVVLGTGKRLFVETTDKKRLQLSSSTVVGEGVAIQVYTRR